MTTASIPAPLPAATSEAAPAPSATPVPPAVGTDGGPAGPATTSPPTRSRRGRTARALGALAQLAAVGVVGSVIFGVLATLLSLGISLVLLFGIGLLFLLAFVYALYATAWLEYERVEGLYRYGLPALRARRRDRPGFAGWLRSVWDQFTDGPMWRGIASAAVSTILGLFVLPLVGGLASSLVLLFAPLLGGDTVRVPITGLHVAVEWALLVGVLGLIVCAALLTGIAVLHGVLTRAILVPNREAQLVEQAREAGTQRESAVRADADLSLSAGALRADGRYSSLDLDLSAGSMSVSGTAQSLDADVSAGRLVLDLDGVDEADLRLSAGAIGGELTGRAPQEVTVDVSAGRLELTLPDASYAVASDVSAGEFQNRLTVDAGSDHRVSVSVSAGFALLRS